MTALALRNPGNAALKWLVPIMVVLMLASVVTISAKDLIGPILELIAIITGLDEVITSLHRTIQNLEKKLPGLESAEEQALEYYERALDRLEDIEAEVAHHESEISKRESKIKTLDGKIASLERTIKACDEWLKYHPDATASEKRKNDKARSDAEKALGEAKSERSGLVAEKLVYQWELVGKRLSLMTAKTNHREWKKAYDKAKRDHDNVKNEILWKKSAKASKEIEREKKGEELRKREQERANNANNNDG